MADSRPRRIEGRRLSEEDAPRKLFAPPAPVAPAVTAVQSPLSPPPTASDDRALSAACPRMAFAPRHFPPPALADIPLAYVLHQLRTLAPHYWNKPETADCTLVIPIPRSARTPATHVYGPGMFAPSTAGLGRRTHDTSNLNRRATEPAVPCLPPLVMKLHVDYLSAHSTLLRALFAGASPLRLFAGAGPHAAALRPRVLPGAADHPRLYLPVPDPAAFQLLVHWCYFRRTALLEDHLAAGRVAWDGLARTAAYLGMPRELRAFLAGYYRHYLAPDAGAPDGAGFLFDASDASDSDSDSDGEQDGEFGGEFGGELSDDGDESDSDSDDSDDDMSGRLEPASPPRGRSSSIHVLSRPTPFCVPPAPVAEVAT